MDATESAAIIEKAGGAAAFAKLIGISEERWAIQRVVNWKSRGIPPAVVLKHQQIIELLRKQVA